MASIPQRIYPAIHRIGKHPRTQVVKAVHLLSGQYPEVRVPRETIDPLVPVAQALIRGSFGKQAQSDSRLQFPEVFQHLPFEAGHQNLIEHIFLTHQVQYLTLNGICRPVRLKGFRLDFDVHQQVPFCRIQHLGQGGQPLRVEPRVEPAAGVQSAQLIQGKRLDRTGSVGGSVHGFVVDHHQVAILGQTNVQFDHMGAGIDGTVERGKGILRVAGTVAPVSDK